ncbi:hypothetical protein NQ314_015138 [Rhamnusium bicolor]|uniref:Uncharacterized protein n=1 Tax=Rhamnusium bicolor TaxID=1586634 RepID=A0AAV8X042_9CUCU|nr:hypothetical protein NQ314_015138 [Rhamnusium bicolor]
METLCTRDNIRIIFHNATSKASTSCKEKQVLLDPNCKTAVITGGAEGIGLATAHQLLCAKAQNVALLGLDAEVGLEAVNILNCSYGKDKAAFYKCDVRCKGEVEDALQRVKADYNKIDILVNAAGIWNDAVWEQEVQTNLVGTINTNLAAKEYIDRGSGVVINIAGNLGLHVFPPSPTMSALQSGIIKFSQGLGHDLNYRKIGIRIIVLCPGITQTKFIQEAEERTLMPEMSKDLEEFLKRAHRQKPEVCGKSVIELIKYGPTGSTWVIEGSNLFYLDFPGWKNYCSLISQFT